MTTRVKMSHPLIYNHASYQIGRTYDVEDAFARRLVNAGYAVVISGGQGSAARPDTLVSTADLLNPASPVREALDDLYGSPDIDLSGYATKGDLGAFLKSGDLSPYAKTSDLTPYAKTTALGPYAKTTDLAGYTTKGDRRFDILKTYLAAAHRGSPRLGPISTDFTAVTINAAGDAVTYNQQYVLAATVLPANWPVDMGEGLQFIVPQGTYNAYAFGPVNAMPRSVRVMCDGDKFCWYTAQGTGQGQMVYVDGRPTSLTPYLATGAYNTITFPSAKPRLIEIRTGAALVAFYTQKPYQLWKPPPLRGPRVLFIGDSYAAGSGAQVLMNGMYWNIGPSIGAEDVWLDHQGGSGYGVHSSAGDGLTAPAGGPNRYLDRITKVISGQTWDVGTIAPDMIVVHGGGANDKYKGRTDAQVIADATSMFTQLRAKCPNAKLVFVEGFAPPLFGTFNPNYIAIRQAVQAALTATGVYYIDVATTSPWLSGTGYAGAPSGTGNNDTYIISDQAHPNDQGHIYIRGRIAEKLRRVLFDDGTLVNQLI